MGVAKIIRMLPLAAIAVVPNKVQAAGQPLVLAPSSGWVVDYAEDSCALRRAFSAGSDTATLQFRQAAPGDLFELTIMSGTLQRTRQAPSIRYQAVDEWSRPDGVLLADDDASHGVVFSDSLRPPALRPKGSAWPMWPDAERDARETAVTELEVTGSFERDLTLRVGAMHAPMEAMRACLRELVTHWGLDGRVQETLSRRVQPVEQRGWSRQILGAYPVDMLRQGKSGRVQVRLIVGADGMPTNCVAIKGTAEPSFETAACTSAMRYARFDPALDAQGQPVASHWSTTIVYQTGR